MRQACSHLGQIRRVTPRAKGCEECLKVGDTWVPFNPGDWRAYASRQRWFRTPNDAFMAGNFHVARTVMQKAVPTSTLSWMQVLLASLYSGAFHPTAEGHAAIADAVVSEARRVLARYEPRSRR